MVLYAQPCDGHQPGDSGCVQHQVGRACSAGRDAFGAGPKTVDATSTGTQAALTKSGWRDRLLFRFDDCEILERTRTLRGDPDPDLRRVWAFWDLRLRGLHCGHFYGFCRIIHLFLLMSPSASFPSLLNPERSSLRKTREVSQEAQLCLRDCANSDRGILKEFSSRMKLSFALATTLASGIALNAAAQVPAAPAVQTATASATTPAAPAGPAKIAVVAFQVAVAQTNEGQRNFADLQKKYDPKRQQLKTLNDEVESLTKQLQTQGDKLSETETRQPRQDHRRKEEAAAARSRRRAERHAAGDAGAVQRLWPRRSTTCWPAMRSSMATRWFSTSRSSRLRCSMRPNRPTSPRP